MRKIIIEDEKGRSVFELMDKETLVGRDPQCDIILSGNEISRKHAMVTLVDDHLLVEDLGSGNGTLVNDEQLEGKTILETGDTMTVGRHTLHIDRIAPAAGNSPGRSGSRERKAQGVGPFVPLIVLGVVCGILLLTQPWKSDPVEPGDQDAAWKSTEASQASTPEPGKTGAPSSTPRNEEVELAHKAVSLEVDALLLQDDYAGAASVLDRFENNYGSYRIGGIHARIRKRTREALERDEARFREQVASKQPEVAVATLKSRLANYPEDSSFRRRIEQLISSTGTRAIAQSGTPAGTPPVTDFGTTNPARKTPRKALNPAEREDARRSFQQAVTRAEAAFGARNYEIASSHWLAAAKFAVTADLDTGISRQANRRAKITRSLSGFKGALVAQMNRNPGLFKPVTCLPGRKGTITSATPEAVTFDLDGEVLSLSWKVLRTDTLLTMAGMADFEGLPRIQASAFLLENEERKPAEKALRNVELAHPELKNAIDQVLANASGMDVPTGGFLWYGEQYVSPRDLERIKTQEMVTEYLAQILDDDPQKRGIAFEKLFELGDRAASEFHRGLLAARAGILKNLGASSSYQQIRGLNKRRLKLDEARDRAHNLIFDTVKYPYPYRGQGQAVRSMYQETQQKIDGIVREIRDMWKNESAVGITSDVREAALRTNEINDQLDRLGMGMGPASPSCILYLPREKNLVTLQTHALHQQEREDIDLSIEYMRLNEVAPTIATNNIKAQFRITNKYRVMMGRHSVRINENLVKCANLHCADMVRLGFFSHFNEKEPKKRTPRDRATFVGFFGSGISENIYAGGGAQGAHNAWCHSSGHHRNILSKSWRILGVGNAGNRWCQNFSIREFTSDELEAGAEDEDYTVPDEDGG